MAKCLLSPTGRIHLASSIHDTSILSESEDINSMVEYTSFSDDEEDDFEEKSLISRSIGSVATSTFCGGSDEEEDDEDDSTELLDPELSSDDDNESFRTARTSSSCVSDAVKSIYETPCEWEVDPDALPNEVQIDCTDGKLPKAKKQKKKKKLKSKQRRLRGVKALLSGIEPTADGYSTAILYSPPPKSKRRLSKRVPRVNLGLELDSCWGDLGSMETSRRLSASSLEGLEGLSDSIRESADSSSLDSSIRDSLSSLCSGTFDMPNSQSIGVAWEDIYDGSSVGPAEETNLYEREQAKEKYWASGLSRTRMDNNIGLGIGVSNNSASFGSLGGSFLDHFTESLRQNNALSKDTNLFQSGSCTLSSYSELLTETNTSDEPATPSEEFVDESGYVRSIRFADEQGLPIHKVHHLGGDDDPMATGRIIVLFLSPTYKKFEFTHLEFCFRDRLTVDDILKQMPTFAISEVFTEIKFHSLYRTLYGGEKLEGSCLLHHCDIEKNEVLVPVMENHTGDELVQSAVPLLRNKSVMRMLKNAKRSGRGLRYVRRCEDTCAAED